MPDSHFGEAGLMLASKAAPRSHFPCWQLCEHTHFDSSHFNTQSSDTTHTSNCQIFGELHTCASSRDLINCFSSAPLHADKMASQAPLTPGKRGKKRNSDLNSVLPHHLTAILPYTNSPLKLHRSGFRCCLLVFIVLCYKTRSVCETH